MAGSTREDFLLRQVRLFAAFLARALGRASAGQLGEAAQLLREAETELLGEKGRVIRRLDTASGAMLLDNPRLIFALAQLCAAEAALARQRTTAGAAVVDGADATGGAPSAGEPAQPAEAPSLERQALEYALEAWQREPGMELLADFIRAAAGRVSVADLGPSYREILAAMPGG